LKVYYQVLKPIKTRVEKDSTWTQDLILLVKLIISKESRTRMKKILIEQKDNLIIVLAVISIFFIASTLMTAQERAISTFKEAIETKNYDKLQQLTSVDKEQLTVFINYINENDEYKQELLHNINKRGKGLVSINETKKFLFLPTYHFTIRNIKATLNVSPYVKKLKMNGKEIPITNTNKITLPVIVGVHPIVATFETEYASFEEEFDLVVTPEQVNENAVVVEDIKGQMIHVNHNLDKGNIEADLYINGKDTGIDINEEAVFGPVPLDGSLTVAIGAQLPFQVYVKSKDRQVVSTKYTFYLNPLNEGEIQKQLKTVIDEYIVSWVEAYRQKDPSKLKHVHKQYRENEGKWIKYSQKDENTFEKLIKTTYDFQQSSFHLLSPENNTLFLARIEVYEQFQYDGDKKFFRKMIYDLVYDMEEKEPNWMVFSKVKIQ
jgi:uncharacterized membrane protein YvbJ